MEQRIDISVIITVYNLEKYIGDCMDSVLEQEGVTFEVICVDDVSTDSSFDILCGYQKEDARVKVIRNKRNMGLASTRNAGFRMAKGEYLYNIDGDDMLVQGALKTMYECAKANDLDLLGFSAQSFFENDIYHEHAVEDEYLRRADCNSIHVGKELFVKLYENGEPVTSNMCLYCIRNEFMEQNDLYDVEGLRYVDDSMFLKYMKARRAMCVPDVLYRRRYREGSAVTSPMKRIYLESMLVLFVEEFTYWKQMEIHLTNHENQVISLYFQRRLQEIDSMSHMFVHDKSEMAYLKQHATANFFFETILKRKLLYADRFSDIDREKILQAKNLIVYGAGYFAEKVTDILEDNNKDDYRVVISGEPQGQKLKGHRVYSLAEAQDFFAGATVVVAIARKYKVEIEKVLNDKEILETVWFDE